MDTRLLASIVCPKCHAALEFDKANNQLICRHDRLIYPVKDNIPVLLDTEATPLPQTQA